MLSALAFLGIGTSELVLILLVFIVLFGAEKAPQLARSLGNARAKLDRARDQFASAVRTEEERAWDEQLAFERERERKVRESMAPALGASASASASASARAGEGLGAGAGAGLDHDALVRAAEELGLQTAGLADAELKAAIRAKLGAGEKTPEKAADARQ